MAKPRLYGMFKPYTPNSKADARNRRKGWRNDRSRVEAKYERQIKGAEIKGVSK